MSKENKMPKKKPRKIKIKRRISLRVMISYVISMLISYKIGEIVLGKTTDLPQMISVGLYYGTIAFVFVGILLVLQFVKPTLVNGTWRKKYFKSSLLMFVPLTFFIVGGAAGGAEYLFETNQKPVRNFSNLVIAVDSSEQMALNDEEEKRFDAVEAFAKNTFGTKKIAVISFSEQAKVDLDFTDMARPDDKIVFSGRVKDVNKRATGNRSFTNLYKTAYDLIKDKAENSTLIILAADMPVTDDRQNMEMLVQDFKKAGIPVYTIGICKLGNKTESFLSVMAEETGGRYIRVKTVEGAADALKTLSGKAQLGSMIKAKQGLYMQDNCDKEARTVAIAAIGFILAVAMGIIFDNKYLLRRFIVAFIISGVAGGLLIDNLLTGDMSEGMIRLIYWLINALTLCIFASKVEIVDETRKRYSSGASNLEV